MATISQVVAVQSISGNERTPSATSVTGNFGDVLVASFAFYRDTDLCTPYIYMDPGYEKFIQLGKYRNTGSAPDLQLGMSYYRYDYFLTSPGSPWIFYLYDYGNTADAPKAVTIMRLRPDPGKMIRLKSYGYTGGYTSTPSIAVPSTAKNDIIVGCGSIAYNATFTDSDTTDGTWSSVYSIASTASTDITSQMQVKQVTGSTAQTYNGTFSASRYFSIGYMVFTEVDAPYWGTKGV